MFKIPDCLPIKYQDTNNYFNLSFESHTEGHRLKEKYKKEGMFAFVSWKWVNPFVEWINNRRCLEVMSGRGILSYALKQKGVNIITTDDYSWFNKDVFSKWNDILVEIEKIDAVEAVKKYGKDIDILIISWPYMDNVAYKTIKQLYSINSEALVVYIGEGYGGCTADDEFHENFKIIEDDNFKKVENNFERWWGLHDRPQLGKYSEQ